MHGDAGSGKTAVVAEAAARAYEQDAVVLYGSCNTDSTPLEPFVGALAGQLTDARVGGATVPALGPLAGELGRLVPEVGALPGVSTPLQADPEAEQYRLFDAVSSWLHAQATEAPLVVVLEDLQWATRDTVLLLRHVVRSTALLPVLFVITFRDAELSDDHPLAGQGPLRAAEVCRYPLVLRSEGSGARTAVEEALLAAGVERDSIQIAAELGSTEAVKRAVEAGLGVGFVSVCTLAVAGPAGELRALPSSCSTGFRSPACSDWRPPRLS